MGHRSVGMALGTSNIVPGMPGDHPASIPGPGGPSVAIPFFFILRIADEIFRIADLPKICRKKSGAFGAFFAAGNTPKCAFAHSFLARLYQFGNVES